MPFPKIILFDAVGTLLYPAPSVVETYFYWGQEFGSRRTATEIAERFPAAFARSAQAADAARFARPATNEDLEWERWRQIVCEIFDDVPEAAAGGLFFQLWEHFARGENWGVYEDAVPALIAIAQAGFPVGVASNFDRRLRPITRSFRGLRPLAFHFVSSEVGYPKPSPQFFAFCEERTGWRGEAILLVGDDVENDYYGALDFGWQAILLDRDGKHPELPAISSLEELPQLLGLGSR